MGALAQKPLLLCVAGGTGGHIFPALAVAQALREQGWEIHWLGSRGGMEESIVPRYHIPLSLMNVSGLRGKGILTLIKAPIKILSSLWFALSLIRRMRPTAVLAMGGFVSGPSGVAAWLTGAPLLVHEQNAIPGLTNRLLSRIATVVMEAFPNSFASSLSAVATGNPVRDSIKHLGKTQTRHGTDQINVLVVGGSRGALALNRVLPTCAQFLLDNQFRVWHQTGKGKLEQALSEYNEEGVDVDGEKLRVEEFIHDMDAAYAWADIVICRSGALTVSELACAGLPSILVPYPFAVDDHQTANAKYLVDSGAAVLLPQSELDTEELIRHLEKFKADPKLLVKMSDSAKKAGHPQSTEVIGDICQKIRIRGEEIAH